MVHLEIFDYYSWPERPQYNIETASRKSITVNGRTVKIFSPEWILREKILAQHEREGTQKEATDLRDIANMLWLVIAGKPELNFDDDLKLSNALGRLLEKRPGVAQLFGQNISFTAGFGTWYNPPPPLSKVIVC